MTIRNRAKCKLCNSIIESYHASDYVICECGEIALDGGDALRCYARSWENFLRIDENNKETEVKIVGEESPYDLKIDRDSLIEELERMVKNIDQLPEEAKTLAVTQYEMSSLLSVIVAVLKLLAKSQVE